MQIIAFGRALLAADASLISQRRFCAATQYRGAATRPLRVVS